LLRHIQRIFDDKINFFTAPLMALWGKFFTPPADRELVKPLQI